MMSRIERIPQSSPSLTTTRWRNPPLAIVSAASSRSRSMSANTALAVRCSETCSVSGSSPLPSERTRSRSVMIPGPGCSGSSTTTAPTLWSAMNFAASRSVRPGVNVSTSSVIASRTFTDRSSPAVAVNTEGNVSIATRSAGLEPRLWDGEPFALVVPGHRADSPARGRAHELGGDRALRGERGALEHAALRVAAEAVRDVAEDLGRAGQLGLLELGQVTRVDRRLPGRDKRVHRHHVGRPDQQPGGDEQVAEALVARLPAGLEAHGREERGEQLLDLGLVAHA